MTILPPRGFDPHRATRAAIAISLISALPTLLVVGAIVPLTLTSGVFSYSLLGAAILTLPGCLPGFLTALTLGGRVWTAYWVGLVAMGSWLFAAWFIARGAFSSEFHIDALLLSLAYLVGGALIFSLVLWAGLRPDESCPECDGKVRPRPQPEPWAPPCPRCGAAIRGSPR